LEVNMDRQDEKFSLDQLEYYQKIQQRNTWLARAMLLSVLVGLLCMNMWMTQRNYEAMLINVDQTRLAQVNLFEAQVERIRQLEARMVLLQQTVQQQQPHKDALVSTVR